MNDDLYIEKKKLAAGGLIVAADTKRILLLKRSKDVDHPFVWSELSGGMQTFESPVDTIEREIKEELSYTGPLKCYEVDKSTNKHSIYYSHIIVVLNEFKPVLQWEHSSYKWTTFDKLPQPLHPKLTIKLQKYKDKINNLLNVTNEVRYVEFIKQIQGL